MNNKIFFDTETTGVDPFNDRIVEIAIVKTDNNLNVIDEFYSLINPTIPIPLEATEVHNISNEDVKTAPTFKEIANEIYEFIKDCDVAGYNSNRFDIPLLSTEFNRVGIEWDLTDRNIIDVYRIETKFHTNKLSDVYKRYTGEELNDSHTALADTLATLTILKHQLKNFNLGNSFEEIEDTLNDGKKRLDIGGKLTYINDEICWNIGKYKGSPLTIDKSYIQWFLKNDIPSDFKKILLKHI